MKLKRREMKVMIPTASMSDIAMLLIIFFMLTTVFRKEMGLKVVLPKAETTEKILKSRDVANIYIDKDGRISVDDNLVEPDRVKLAFKIKIAENPGTIAQIKADKDAEYGRVWQVIDALREAQAYRVVFATEYKKKKGLKG
jgi:biopolymer transport protein ExbD